MTRTLSFVLMLPFLIVGCSTVATPQRDCSIVPSKLVKTFGSEAGYKAFAEAMRRPGDDHQALKIKRATEYLAGPEQTDAGKLFFLQTRARTYSASGQEALSLADYEALTLMPDLTQDRRQYFQSIVDNGISPLAPLKQILPDNTIDVAPIVRIPPRMPQSFLNRDNSGHCAVKFDVDTSGKVVNATTEYCTHADLKEASLTSIQPWKYSPKTVDGKPVLRQGLQTRISFNLQDQCGYFFPE